MATGQEAIDLICDVTDISRSVAMKVTAALRGAGMWPMAGKGGGVRAVHVEAEDMAHFLIALAVANPSIAAADVVPLYANAVRAGGPFTGDVAEVFPATVRACSGDLGFAVSDLILELAAPKANEITGISVVLGRNPQFRAFGEIYLEGSDNADDLVVRRLGLYVGEIDRGRGAMGRFQISTTIPAAVWAAAASLVADTRARGIAASVA